MKFSNEILVFYKTYTIFSSLHQFSEKFPRFFSFYQSNFSLITPTAIQSSIISTISYHFLLFFPRISIRLIISCIHIWHNLVYAQVVLPLALSERPKIVITFSLIRNRWLIAFRLDRFFSPSNNVTWAALFGIELRNFTEPIDFVFVWWYHRAANRFRPGEITSCIHYRLF